MVETELSTAGIADDGALQPTVSWARENEMAETNFSLVDLKALSEPVTKLIEAVRSAVGILYEPTRTRRQAKAEADAAIILAENQTEVREIEIRASERLRNRELRRQQNVEKVTRMAIAELPASVSADPVDEDWIHQFFGHCQDISNEQMQSLWARLLAGEVAKPGSFSYRSLRLVKDLRREDADLFTRFCTFIWRQPGVRLVPIVPSAEDDSLRRAGIGFTDLLHLESLGLIQFNSLSGFKLTGSRRWLLEYYGKPHFVAVQQGKEDLQVGKSLLTAVGEELAHISGSKPDPNYRDATVARWRKDKMIVADTAQGLNEQMKAQQSDAADPGSAGAPSE